MSIQNLFFYLLTYYFGLLGLTKFTCQHADVNAFYEKEKNIIRGSELSESCTVNGRIPFRNPQFTWSV